jgi:hypothetical protein
MRDAAAPFNPADLVDPGRRMTSGVVWAGSERGLETNKQNAAPILNPFIESGSR